MTTKCKSTSQPFPKASGREDWEAHSARHTADRTWNSSALSSLDICVSLPSAGLLALPPNLLAAGSCPLPPSLLCTVHPEKELRHTTSYFSSLASPGTSSSATVSVRNLEILEKYTFTLMFITSQTPGTLGTLFSELQKPTFSWLSTKRLSRCQVSQMGWKHPEDIYHWSPLCTSSEPYMPISTFIDLPRWHWKHCCLQVVPKETRDRKKGTPRVKSDQTMGR